MDLKKLNKNYQFFSTSDPLAVLVSNEFLGICKSDTSLEDKTDQTQITAH